MAKKLFGVVVSVLLAVVATVGSAQQAEETIGLGEVGQGSLLAATETPGRYLEVPLQSTEVEITVRGLVVEAVVEQAFENRSNEWLEGVYVFPLPQGAAVHAMRLIVGDRVIEGEVQEREAARKVYQKAKTDGKKASLVEQERPNIFTTSVANIGPGESVAVRIAYQEILEYDSGRFSLRFPMVVGPRYIPGAPVETTSEGTGWAFDTDQVPDASRITPPVLHPSAGKINPVKLNVTLDAGMPLERLICPSHPAQISTDQGGIRNIGLEGTFADRDFVLEWVPARGREPRAAVFTEELDGAYYVLAMVMPPADEFVETVRLPRETVFVIDTSGSMGGASILQARQALLMALDQLRPEDFFNIIEFDSRFTVLYPESRPAIPAAVTEAKMWVERLDANGGTEMMGPLLAALSDRFEHTPLRQIIFITDGCVGNGRHQRGVGTEPSVHGRHRFGAKLEFHGAGGDLWARELYPHRHPVGGFSSHGRVVCQAREPGACRHRAGLARSRRGDLARARPRSVCGRTGGCDRPSRHSSRRSRGLGCSRSSGLADRRQALRSEKECRYQPAVGAAQDRGPDG